jgi:uncharacterized membrane protein YgdD (TMEM256/DUF423 family)
MDGWTWVRIGAASGFLAVALGAFGAHYVRNTLLKVEETDSASVGAFKQRRVEIFETASRYQMYHALAMIAVGIVAVVSKQPGTALGAAGWAFLGGTLLFSGSLYALALTGQTWLGAITPFGGVAFLVGWLALAAARLSEIPSP